MCVWGGINPYGLAGRKKNDFYHLPREREEIVRKRELRALYPFLFLTVGLCIHGSIFQPSTINGALPCLVSAFNHLFRWGLYDDFSFLCANTTTGLSKSCETQNYALAQKIIAKTRPGSNESLLQFPEFVRFITNSEANFTALNNFVNTHWSGLASHWQPFSSNCSPCDLLPHVLLEVDLRIFFLNIMTHVFGGGKSTLSCTTLRWTEFFYVVIMIYFFEVEFCF